MDGVCVWKMSVILALATTGWTLQTLQTNADEPRATVLHVLQHSKLSGDLEIFMSAKGLKVFFKNPHTQIFASAPDWTVYKYNLVTKKYCVIPAIKFSNSLSRTRSVVGGTTYSDVVLHKTGVKSYAKYMQNVYTTDLEHYKRAFAMYKHREVTGDYPFKMEIDGLLTNNCAPEELRFLNIIDSLPKIAEFPISAESTGLDGKRYVYLSTSALSEIPQTAGTFAQPANFKKVANENQLNEDVEFNENFLDFMKTESHR